MPSLIWFIIGLMIGICLPNSTQNFLKRPLKALWEKIKGLFKKEESVDAGV